MKRCFLLLTTGWLFAIASATDVTAAGYGGALHLACWPKFCFGACPDDYRAKPCPPVPCASRCGSCDRYCPKPLPWVECEPRGCECDCYQRRPLPVIPSGCSPEGCCQRVP